MELEELDPTKLLVPGRDVETIESWADPLRNAHVLNPRHAGHASGFRTSQFTRSGSLGLLKGKTAH